MVFRRVVRIPLRCQRQRDIKPQGCGTGATHSKNHLFLGGDQALVIENDAKILLLCAWFYAPHATKPNSHASHGP